MEKERRIHMIGHAHLDPVWLWCWQEGFQEAKATFRSALDRMKEYPNFKFSASSAAFYDWIEKNEPTMFQEIAGRVAEGRWEIVGGWWVEPDCNIPAGESYVRQGLYGQRFFLEKFGRTARVGFNADSFGHNGALPQILKKSGLDYYVFTRPTPNNKALPNPLFWWESEDGSRVLAFRILYEYLSWGKELLPHISRCAAEIRSPYKEIMCFYGVGNHGGGPTKENIESITQVQEQNTELEVLFSTTEQYFQSVGAQDVPIPSVCDDLQHQASGCYAAHSGIKKLNRRAENVLLKAEKFSLLANWVTGQPYPADFSIAWKSLLFCQFHDILAGTSLEEAYDDAHNMIGESITIAERNLNYAVQSLSWNMKIPAMEGCQPLVVFNPHSWPIKANVENEIANLPDYDGLCDDQERPVPMQQVQSHVVVPRRFRVSFLADVPPWGYRVYFLRKNCPTPKFAHVTTTETSLENKRWLLEFDKETGFIKRLYDKKQKHEVFAKQAARPVVVADHTDTWGHGELRFDREIGVFTPVEVRVVEEGPVKAILRVTSKYNASTLVQDFAIFHDLEQIEVAVTVNWQEQHSALKLKFPVNLGFCKSTYEIPYSSIERPLNGEEEPGQGWIDVTGVIPQTQQVYGVSLLNDSKYSFDIWNREMSITVLRSPIYAHHDPAEPLQKGEYSFIDQGVQRFTYAILPHIEDWREAKPFQKAAELNQRLVSLLESPHPQGTLPLSASFITVDQQNIVVSVIKQAEDGPGQMVLRCYETDREQTAATIGLPRWGRTITALFQPSEIKTYIIPQDVSKPIVESDLLEL